MTAEGTLAEGAVEQTQDAEQTADGAVEGDGQEQQAAKEEDDAASSAPTASADVADSPSDAGGAEAGASAGDTQA